MTDDAPPAPREARLVVLRHGDTKLAHDRMVLTAESQRLASAAARTIQGLGAGPVVIFTSQVERALITGTAISRILGAITTAVPWLTQDKNEAARGAIQGALQALPADGTLVLITHCPQVRQLTGVDDPLYLTPYVQTVLV